ncbi:unnamed protein product [marine sediment metagenome]|uniref:Uncharacterized protein n=1 Tax=marine sediment metagenome TaxID=412755 RepID=X1A6T9_9ZZZZ
METLSVPIVFGTLVLLSLIIGIVSGILTKQKRSLESFVTFIVFLAMVSGIFSWFSTQEDGSISAMTYVLMAIVVAVANVVGEVVGRRGYVFDR